VLDGVIVGVIGTGMMATAHAFRHSQQGLPVVIGSREPSKAHQLAAEVDARRQKAPHSVGPAVRGGSHAMALEAANFIILAIPATCLRPFLDQYRQLIVGKGKCFVDLSVTFSRFGSPQIQPPTLSDGPGWRGPYFDMVNYLRDRLGDPSTQWVKAWHNLYYKSIMDDKRQPVECAGDPRAKAIAMEIMFQEGWEPLDCGGIDDVPNIETGFHPRRRRHPRHLEFNGPNHP